MALTPLPENLVDHAAAVQGQLETTNINVNQLSVGIPNYQSAFTYDIGNQIRGDGTNGAIGATYTCNTNSTTGAFNLANWDINSSGNAYAPTTISSSGTLTTSISMLIATGAGGYTTTLPDASTFPASQLGKPIYYVNNSSAANSIGVETGGYTSVTFSITGATTTPPLYALSSTTLPTVSNMTIAGNVATATANSASAQTFDYVTTNNILQVIPKMTFTNGNVLSVDPTSATGSTKFNYSVNNTVQVGSKVQVDVGGTVNEITVAAGSQVGTGLTVSGFILPYPQSDGSVIISVTGNNTFIITNSTLSSYSQSVGTTPGGISVVRSIVKLGANYYLSGDAGDGVYETSNFSSFTKVLSATIANAQIYLTVVGGAIYAFETSLNSGSNAVKFSKSTNGTTWNTQSNLTTLPTFAAVGNTWQLIYANNSFLACGDNFVGQSLDDGVTWTFLATRTANQISTGSTSGNTGINYFNGKYIISVINLNNTATSAILTSSTFTASVWTGAVTGISSGTVGNLQIDSTNSNIYMVRSGANTLYKSSDGTTWSVTSSTGDSTIAYELNVANGVFAKIGASPTLSISLNNAVTWQAINLSTISGYTFTMTSPTIAVPTWAGLGGQTEEYSVSATSTPSFTAATTPAYTRSTNDITVTYAAVTPSAYTHLQLKALTMNSGDVLKQIGADIRIDVDFNITIPVGGKYQLIPTSTAGWQSFQFAG